MNLPIVTIETIKEVGNEAITGSDAMFHNMAASNPELYRFVYEVYQLPDTTKERMLGMVVATYHVLDREMGKHKQLRKRVRKSAL